jgi:PE family
MCLPLRRFGVVPDRQRFVTLWGPNFPVIYEQADSHCTAVRTAGNNVADTNSGVGCSSSEPTRQGGHMSFVTTQPEMLAAAAGDLEGIGSAMSAENVAAAAPTTGVVPAAADEVSALTAAQFAAHAQIYQAMSAQAAAINEMFVNTLGTSAGSYAATEAANTVAAS